MVPDGQSRRMLLDYGYQSKDVPSLTFSDSVRSPGDSSFVEVVRGGVTEFRSEQRVRFAPNAVYDVFTLSKLGEPTVLDSVLITNANAALTTLPVAQVRLVNLIPDTSRTFEIRLGCPNGGVLTRGVVPFGVASLYSEVFPGLQVFSILENRSGVQTVLGTYQAVLSERVPYSVIVYRDAASDKAQLLFIQESDLTSNAERAFVPVVERTADLRVVNIANTSVDVVLASSGKVLAKGLGTMTVSAASTAVTCESDRADVFRALYADGRNAEDSTSLAVRGKFTVYTADSAGSARMIITPTIQRPFGSVGKAVVRVVNVSSTAGPVVVSLGARSDATAQNGIAAGYSIARNIAFGSTSEPTAVAPGLLPLSVTTSTTPTTIIDVARAVVEADKTYDLVVYTKDGKVNAALLEQETSSTSLTPLDEGVFVKVMNGSSRQPSVPLQVGAVLPSGTLFYGNSIATTLPVGSIPYVVGNASGFLTTRSGERTLAVYAEGNSQPQLLQITTPPLIPQMGLTKRRVINATEDVAVVSASVDSIPTVSGEGDHLAVGVAYGGVSPVSVSDLNRRGTYYFYNAATLEKLYTLPMQIAPMGNNYSFVVVGRAETGYEVIVSQEY